MNESSLGKKAERKIKEWLNNPSQGYCFYRIPDQMSGFYMSSNPCDFLCYKYPNLCWIESKTTIHDRWDFSQLTDVQRNSLYEFSQVDGVYGLVIVLFSTYKRAVILDIRDIVESGEKSINIKKIDKWSIPYAEIQTIPSRKELLDYTGSLEDYIAMLRRKFNETVYTCES